MRDELRTLKSLAGPFPHFDPDAAPDGPQQLFAEWLRDAIRMAVPEPHSMVLSTVDETGAPDARVLILKNIDQRGWHFATTNGGSKGRQIALNPFVALTFYWSPLGRQIRIRGVALELDSVERHADFRARPTGSKAAALLARQSDTMSSTQELDQALLQQQARLIENPDIMAENWTVFAVMPHDVEFWQGDQQRRHIRLRYSREKNGWRRDRLWP